MTLIPFGEAFSQSGTSTGEYLRHQVGFNATESIRLFDQEMDQVYKLYYRLRVAPRTTLRSGVNYRMNTSGKGMLELNIKAGADREFRRSGNWRFYSGFDLDGGIEELASSTRKNYRAGLTPFLGILYYIDNHFSISTEPGLMMGVLWYKNEDTFNPDNSETWVEMNFSNVGQIIISLHF